MLSSDSALRWHNSHFPGNLKPPREWVNPDKAWIPHSFKVINYGILPMRKHFPTKNPRAMCSKLILSESCSNEFVQGKERLNNQGTCNIWSLYDPVIFKKQSQSNINMGFREFCFVLNPLSIMTNMLPSLFSWPGSAQKAADKFRRTRAQEPSCWTGLLSQCSIYPRLIRTDTYYLYLEGKCSN